MVDNVQAKNGECAIGPLHPKQTRAKSGIFKPKVKSYFANIKKKKKVEIKSIHMVEEPRNAANAPQSKEWENAMFEEMTALKRNNTWTQVPFSNSNDLVGNKWVFKKKFNQDGSVARLKARLVAKGFHQYPGLDFNEIFSPVVKAPTTRIILTIVVANKVED